MKPLRIALTKGRLEKDTIGLLESAGYDCTAVREKGRKLILPIGDGDIEVVLAKAADVITYVENGVCDLGVVGKDTIMEENVITGIVIAGNIYNVMANGVKCPQCAVKDLCLRGKLGSKVQFDCASIHLEKAS